MNRKPRHDRARRRALAFTYDEAMGFEEPSTIRTLADFLGALSTGDVDGLYGQMRADLVGERSAA